MGSGRRNTPGPAGNRRRNATRPAETYGARAPARGCPYRLRGAEKRVAGTCGGEVSQGICGTEKRLVASCGTEKGPGGNCRTAATATEEGRYEALETAIDRACGDRCHLGGVRHAQ